MAKVRVTVSHSHQHYFPAMNKVINICHKHNSWTVSRTEFNHMASIQLQFKYQILYHLISINQIFDLNDL